MLINYHLNRHSNLYELSNDVRIIEDLTKEKPKFEILGFYIRNTLRNSSRKHKPLSKNIFIHDSISSISDSEKCKEDWYNANCIVTDNSYEIKNIINGGKTMTALSNTAIDYARKRIKEYMICNIKNKLGVEYKFKFTNDQYLVFLKWLKKYDHNFKNHIIKNNKNSMFKYSIKDIDIIVRIDKNTFCRITTGKNIINRLSDIEKYKYVLYPGEINIYAFGKNCYKVMKELLSIDESNELNCYKVSPSSRFNKDNMESLSIFREKLNKRNKDTIFLCNDIENKLFDHIDKFIHNKIIYEKRNLNYKTGILLYGLPGTGKTSIASMICTKYNINMILINMSEFSNINIEELTSSINADDEQYLILLEDIDCVIGNRESKDDDNKNKKNVNKLLQFLDSTSSPSNVIFIATTNHIEKLDKAILRDGRFDLILNIDNIDRKTAIKMCKSFHISDNDIEDILKSNMENGKINPAKLQNLILQKIENYSN